MIRIYSIQQAMFLRGTIPELAIIRSIQFQGDGYAPLDHGHFLVLEPGDDPACIEEIEPHGLFVDDLPVFEYVEIFVAGGQVTFEIVVQLDDERTLAIIADEKTLSPHLRQSLQELSPPPQPLPSLERKSS